MGRIVIGLVLTYLCSLHLRQQHILILGIYHFSFYENENNLFHLKEEATVTLITTECNLNVLSNVRKQVLWANAVLSHH